MSLSAALAAAYANNPTLNGARAEQRAVDEGVPQALSGYRPTVAATVQAGPGWGRSSTPAPPTWVGPVFGRTASVVVEQPLFAGFRTVNSVKAAESAVLAGRESLRNTEQTVLLNAVSAYMSVVQQRAIVGLTQQNLDFLREQTRAAQDRLDVGEGTRTDLAQTQAAESAGLSDYNLAVANLNAAIAVFVQTIGEQPKNLSVAPAAKSIPKSADAVVNMAMERHPAILATQYNVDIGAFNVSILEGGLLPTVSVTGTYTHSNSTQTPGAWSDQATVVGRLSVPIYEGGAISSQVRQAKERLGGLRIQVDATRDSIRAEAVTAYGLLSAGRASITAAEAGVRAANLALEGIVEERKVGQATTLDVLTAQQTLLNARVSLVQAQYASVVGSYRVLAAIGGLSAANLGLNVATYQPEEHYRAVRDKWYGLRTPDGR